MEKVLLGKSNLSVSKLGLGIGGIFGMHVFNEKKAISLIHKSIDLGLNFFDTGSSYSYGNAEIRLGKALQNKDKDSLVIATKGGTVLKRGGGVIKDFSRQSLIKNLEKSLKNLRLEKIDLFQLHSPRFNDLNDEVIETLQLMKDSGKILNTGISCGEVLLKRVIDLGFFDTVMATYNIVNFNSDKLLKNAKLSNIGTIAKSPLAHTVFSNDIFRMSDIAKIWYLLRILKNFKSKFIKSWKFRFLNNFKNFTAAELALKYVVNNKNIDSVMIGTTSINHLKENINSINKEYPDDIFEKKKKIQRL